MTHTDLGAMIGVDHSMIYQWETGRLIPAPARLAQLAPILAIDEDEVWLDTYTLKPDMMAFLTTTVEGNRVVQNIRTIMTRLEATQRPTTRRGVPEGIHIPIYRHKPVQSRTQKKKARQP